MAEIKSEILNKVQAFLKLLAERGISVSAAYIYGSYARNTASELSDIDIAVVSEMFEGNILIDLDKFIGLSRKVDSRISVLPLNEESLDSYFVQKEVIQKGYKVY
jgi:predicted nucleotidyltransferase